MNPYRLWHVVISMTLISCRVMLIGHASDLLMNCFKDFAHLYIGGLIGAYAYSQFVKPSHPYFLLLAAVLAIVEVGCAVAGAVR